MTELPNNDCTILRVEGRWRNGGKSVGEYVELDTVFQPELLDVAQLPQMLREDYAAMDGYPSDITYDYRITYIDANEVAQTIEVDVRDFG